MLSEVKQTTIVIDGRVQFIGFRGYIEELALKYNLGGFVYNDLQENNIKFICEGEISDIEKLVEDVQKYPGVTHISFLDRIVLPKPVGRIVVGVERDIFERLDLGVSRLGSINGRLASIESHTASMDANLKSIDTTLEEGTSILKGDTSTLKENTGLLKDIKEILQKIAEK